MKLYYHMSNVGDYLYFFTVSEIMDDYAIVDTPVFAMSSTKNVYFAPFGEKIHIGKSQDGISLNEAREYLIDAVFEGTFDWKEVIISRNDL